MPSLLPGGKQMYHMDLTGPPCTRWQSKSQKEMRDCCRAATCAPAAQPTCGRGTQPFKLRVQQRRSVLLPLQALLRLRQALLQGQQLIRLLAQHSQGL